MHTEKGMVGSLKVLLMPNLDKENALSCTKSVCMRLKELQCKVYMDNRFKNDFEDLSSYGHFYSLLDKCDIIIAIGGDGTIIHSSKHAIAASKPILGINAGRLGFLAKLEPSDLDMLEKLITGDYKIDKRMLLEVKVISNGVTKTYHALNDAVVSNGALSRMVDIDVHSAGRLIGTYRADGIIFSTPTGSTAYALSAGGPIIDPDINCISMTPICPHSLTSRTIIFSENDALQITLKHKNTGDLFLTVDGEKAISLKNDDIVNISKASIYADLIDFEIKKFYEVMNEKIMMRG